METEYTVSLERKAFLLALKHVVDTVKARLTPTDRKRAPSAAQILFTHKAGRYGFDYRAHDYSGTLTVRAAVHGQSLLGQGALLIDGCALYEFARISKAAQIALAVREGALVVDGVVFAGVPSALVNGLETPLDGAAYVSTYPGALYGLLTAATPAMSSDETRMHMNGVLLSRNRASQTMRAVASDGHRLQVAQTPDQPAEDVSLMIGAAGVQALHALLKSARGQFCARFSQTAIGCLLADRGLGNTTREVTYVCNGTQFPAYEQVVPAKFKHAAFCTKREPFLVALKQAALVAERESQRDFARACSQAATKKQAPKRPANALIGIRAGLDGVALLADGTETRIAAYSPAQHTLAQGAKPLVAWFNTDYLVQAVETHTDLEISLWVALASTETAPITITSGDAPSLTTDNDANRATLSHLETSAIVSIVLPVKR